jgi:hypothetical protein
VLSLYQIEELNKSLARLTAGLSDAIRNKPVKRSSKGLGSFESPVNASGALADSIEYEIGDNEIRILALDYIDSVITGTPPGSKPLVSNIEKWLAHKGLNYNPTSVSEGIDRYGSSIWQEWQGRESNLFEDFITNGELRPEILDEIIEAVESKSIQRITEEILTQFAA